MDSVRRSAVTPSKSRLARTLAKVLHIRPATAIASDNEHKTKKSREKIKEDPIMNPQIPSCKIEDQELLKRAIIKEAFLAKLFASVSSVKAAYAQLQLSQFPYDADNITSSDQIIVFELKNLSALKQSYLKEELDESSPETSLLLSELQEQKSLLKTYETMSRKMDSQLKLKDSEITFLKEKLVEANGGIKSLEKELNSSRQFAKSENKKLPRLRPSHFINSAQQAIKSIRSFVHVLISEMQSAGWDLDYAACAIEPGISLLKPNHKCFAFESFVCRKMFDGFSYHNFSTQLSYSAHKSPHNLYFDRFIEMKSVRVADYLAWKPRSRFALFCLSKYLQLIHPKMEASLFGNLDQRNMVNSGKIPETPFFSSFSEMAKRVWLLHCLAFSFDPEVSIFQVKRGCRFSEVYMESLNDEAFSLADGTPETDPQVGFTVVPGFRIGKTIIQCHVYLC